MKLNKKNKFIGITVAALATVGLASCQNELSDSYTPGESLPAGAKLVHSADVVAWSGDRTLGSTFGAVTYNRSTRASQGPVMTAERVESKDIDREKEAEFLNQWFAEGTDNHHVLNHDFLFHAEEDLEFEMYPVYTQTSHSPNFLGIFYYDEKGFHQEIIWDNINYYSDLVREDNGVKYSQGVRVSIKKGYKFGFFIEGNNSRGEIVTYYSKSELNPAKELDWSGNEVDVKSRIHAGTFTEGGETYLCFEDWTDFDFQDIIYAATKELPSVGEDETLPDDFIPGLPEEGPGDGDEDDDPEVDTPEGDGTVGQLKHNNEVEVNLSILDTHVQYDIEDLVTKLSIHVRYPHDVEVKIPVPSKYFVMADDLNIVEAHYLVLEQYGSDHSSTYYVDGNAVTLTVSYEDGGVVDGEPTMNIVVRTDGINEMVIDYLMEKHSDGINFEVWNYYKFNEYDSDGNLITEGKKPTAEQISELKRWLDQSSISFIEGVNPDYYINAFNDTADNPQDVKDCTVTPKEEWLERKDNMPHLNSGSSNVIYYYTDERDALHKHV